MLWIVEAKVTLPKTAKWVPCIYYTGIRGVFFTRAGARAASKRMFEANQYNTEKWTACRYRVSKYIQIN